MLEAHGLVKSYGDFVVLDGISLSLRAGEVFALMGPSGSGKTTLLRSLAFLERPDEGRVLIDGEEVENGCGPWPKVTVVFQDLFLWPHMTNFQNIFRPALLRRRHLAAEETDRLAEAFSIRSIMARYPNQVSRGQRQIVALLRALVLCPKYLLLDEITASLDIQRISLVAEHLRDLAATQSVGVLIITHQLGFAKKVANRFGYLKDGVIVEQGGAEIFEAPKTKEFSEYLDLVAAGL